MIRKTVSLVVLCALAVPVSAELYTADEFSADDEFFDDFYGSEEMVEIATGIKTQIYKAPAIASVYTAEQIKNMGATDIDDVLETVPGLHVTRLANSYLPIYTFRGVHSIYNPQVLMLINGVPITNTFLGNRNQNWLGMPVEAIARIEVIRGPGSAVYGADAFSGVINIVIKNADDIKQNEIAARAGKQSTQDYWLAVADKLESLEYSLTLEYHKTDGSDKTIASDTQTRIDNATGTNASHAPGQLSLGTENLDFRGEIKYQDWTVRGGLQRRTNGGIGAGLAEALDPEANKASERWNLDVNYKKALTESFTLDVQGSYFTTSQDIKNNYTIYPAGAVIGGTLYPDGFIGNPEVFERHTRFNAAGLYTGIENHTLRFGLGYHLGDLYKVKESKNFSRGPDGNLLPPGSPVVDVSDTDYVFLKETDRENHYAFIQDIWNFANDWELTAGVRFDDYTDFGNTTNPRLALVWSTSLNLSTKLLYGKAFRAPSFAETGNINNPVTLGNPDLQPEEMETVELAFDYHPQSGFGTVWSFYRYKWSDIIQFVPDVGANSKTAQNYGEQEGYGAEIEVNWQINKQLKLASNFVWSKATNDLTDSDVAFVPQSQFYLQLDWKISDEFRAHMRNNWVRDRKRDEQDMRSSLDDYVLTDMTLRWQPSDKDLEFALIVKNVFDQDAREPSLNNGQTVNLPDDLPLSGRTWLGEMRVYF
ncbi:TonB-dependent receptor [Thalassomonas sp. RHCl1]|uniref:TonB-dependent receptor plug domain-containing protein n=1 Tax=Thalassomonas sp. RHCl1 TaxID=2995320 RepID=UPI00248A9ABA|nr:TonB-dependent receptor [Thalassomonas sp. RHCl1]